MMHTDEYAIREQARIALEQGKISAQEHEYYLEHKLAEHRRELQETTHPHATKIGIGAMMLLVCAFVVWALITGTPTGLVVFDEFYASYSENSIIPLNQTNINSFRVSGTFTQGEFHIYLNIGDEQLLAFEGRHSLPKITTTYESYAKGSVVEIVVNATNYTLWLNDATENSSQINNTIQINESGNYSVDVLISENGTTVKETTSFIVRADGSAQQNILREKERFVFTNKCIETCSVNTLGENLSIEIQTTGKLDITNITTTQNTPPTQIAQIPNVTVNNTTTLNLSTYFNDIDGDALVFDLNNIVGVEETIQGSQLTLASNVSGTYEATLYVSDLSELLQTTFTITVVEQEMILESVTNQTTNETSNVTTNNTATSNTSVQNVTVQQTITQPNITTGNAQQILSSGLGCEHPNINKRPASCFSEVMDDAFEDIVAPFRDKTQQRVGRITRFGNLIIGGVVVENSASEPSSQDFVLGYSQTQNFVTTFTPTLWIDSTTGDMHLRGQLYEEEKEMQPPQYNSFISVNEKGIILSYVNEITGDLYLRGNIVQLGKP